MALAMTSNNSVLNGSMSGARIDEPDDAHWREIIGQ
jgi:hypothetical protein